MDRRGLLRGAFGVGLAAVTTKLWVPSVSTALAQPDRTVFVPPASGWITGVDWASGPDEQAWIWGTNDSLKRYAGLWLDQPQFGQLCMATDQPGNHRFVVESSMDGKSWTSHRYYEVADGISLMVPVLLGDGWQWRARQVLPV